MNPLEVVLGLIVVVMVGYLMKNRYRLMADPTAHPDSVDTLRLQDEVRQLRERVQVLERVITDNHGSVDLDRQIERLRDR